MSHPPHSKSSPQPAAAPTPQSIAFDKLLQRLESTFSSSTDSKKKSTTVAPPKLDENASDLLFELERALTNTDKSILSRHQSHLEKLFLSSILLKCDNYLLRTVSSSCLMRLYALTSHNVSNAYHDLLKYLEMKDLSSKVIGLQCFATLTRRFGQQFMLSIPETLTVLGKITKSREEVVLKELSLDVIDAYYASTTGSPRSPGSNEMTYMEMVKLLTRWIGDKSDSVRKRCFTTMRSIMFYSIDGRESDALLTIGLKALSLETVGEVRYHAADSLGDLLSFTLKKDWNKIGEMLKKSGGGSGGGGITGTGGGLSLGVGSKTVRKVNGELRTFDDLWIFIDRQLSVTNQRSTSTATTVSNLALRTSYMHMLGRCLRNLSAHNPVYVGHDKVRLGLEGDLATEGRDNVLDDTNVVTQVQRFLGLLSKTKFTTYAPHGLIVGGPASLAAFALPSKEAPIVDIAIDQNIRQMHSCIVSGLIVHILPFQNERGLENVAKCIVTFLTTLIKQGPSVHGDIHTNYQVLTCFQLLGFIFHRLGLAIEYLELKDSCLEVLLYFLNHSQYAIRIACAQCFRALARAASPQIATWLSVLYKIVVMQLVEVTDSQENAIGNQGRKAVDIDPTPYHALHGHISALAAIVGVIPEAPCGVPSIILDSIYDVAKRLVGLTPSENAPSNNIHLHTLVEGGWLLLSSLISLGVEWNAQRLNSLFLLWRACLGKKPIAGKQRQEDVNLELKVRMKALVALRTFTHVMRFRLQMTLVQGVIQPSPILKATIIFLKNTFSLLKALQSEKALDPSVQVSLATLKAVLMDLFASLPSQAYANTFVPLLHIVVSEFTSKNPCLSSELTRILTRADSILSSPNISAGPSGGCEESLVRFMDLADCSDTNPIASPQTGIPIPADTSFYDICVGGGMVCPDYSWNWVLRAGVYTETAKELASKTSAQAATTTTPNTATSGTTSTNGVASDVASLASHDDLSEKVLDGLAGEGFDDAPALAVDQEGLDPDSLAARPLWTSLKNHHDRYGAGLYQHAIEVFEAPSVRSVNACIRLFGSLYADQSSTHQEQLAKHFLAIVTKAKAMNSMHSNIVTNAATALLAVARDLAERDQGVRSQTALDTLLAIANELMSAGNPLVRRAVGETLGLLVRGSDGDVLSKLVTALQNQLHSKDQSVVSTAVFALGCVHRYGGAMKTMRHLPFTVAALQSLGRDFTEPFRVWILHSLWLAIDTGGLSFSAYVQPTLAILTAHASHDLDCRSSGVSQTLSRILHAVMCALGPDVATGAPGVDKFLNLWSHLRMLALQPGNMSFSTTTLVEVIGVLHQLAMWCPSNELELIAPAALDLLATCLSQEDEELRRVTVRCILQMGEKDTKLLIEAGFERRIVSMIDSEQSAGMSALVKHTIASWVQASGSAESASADSASPSLRVRLFDVVKRAMVGGHKLPSDSLPGVGGKESTQASAATRNKKKSNVGSKDDDGKDDDDDDDDGDILSSGGGGGGSGVDNGTKKSFSSSSSSSDDSSPVVPFYTPTETRWQTKSFALDCLTNLMRVAGKTSDPTIEFDLAYARKHAKFPLQYTVQQLPDLLTVACLATSSVYDMLRMKGTSCMKSIVEVFGSVLDPDGSVEEQDPDVGGSSAGGILLLQLYSAQVTSALSQSMKNKSETLVSAPQLRAKACELAVVYLTSGVTTDPIVFGRIIKLLLGPLLNPLEVLTNLNNQFDGNMATLVVLSHLHALGELHRLVLANPDLGSASSSSSSRRHHKSKRLTPQQAAINAIKETLAPHFALLTLNYFQALKDYILVSTLSRKELTKLKGFYFDGATTSNPLPVYLGYWDIFLSNCCMILESDGRPIGESSLSGLIASDGSVGGERAAREMLAIVLGVIGNVMTLIATHEIKVAGMNGSNTGVGGVAARISSQADKLKRASNLDGSTLSKTDRERDSSCVLSCLNGLHGLFQSCHLVPGRLTLPVLHELLPLVAWNLSHRPAGGDLVALERRQHAAIQLLTRLFETLKEMAEDGTKMDVFLATTSAEGGLTSGTLDGTMHDEAQPIDTLIHAIGEILSTTVYQFLPTFGVLQVYHTNVLKLAEGSIYLPSDVSTSIEKILKLLPTFLQLVARVATQDQRGVELQSSQVTIALNLCQHVMRKATNELTHQACMMIQTIVIQANTTRNEQQQKTTQIPTIIVQQLTQQIRNVLLNPLPLNTDFRVEVLLASLYFLAIGCIDTDCTDDQVRCDAIARFTMIWNEFQTHPGSRFRLIAWNTLHKYVIVTPDEKRWNRATCQHIHKCLVALLQQVSRPLLLTMHSPDSQSDESHSAAVCALNVFHSLDSSSHDTDRLRQGWLPLVLPLLIEHLTRVPHTITYVVALATQQATLFKANVALLPLDSRLRLQSCVLSMTPTQQSAAMEQVAAVASRQQQAHTDEATHTNPTKVSKKSSKKRAEPQQTSSANHADSSPSIALSMDFANFKKK